MITPIYAAIASLFFVALSFRALLLRRKLGIPIGAGENQSLERAIAAHANFAEYVPLALILIYFLETGGASTKTVHIFCLVLLSGRVLHAFGVSRTNENIRFRVAGMVLTLGVIISCSTRLLGFSLLL